MQNDAFWKLDHRTDQQLLAGLERLVRSCRRDTAELVAHLGEVEARRLHLEAACSSMFDYCVKRLGLSEDEACRRIDVARLGRRFPALFPRLASGEISLTVAAALKPYLAHDNQTKVLAAVAGKSVRQARETLAALFPRPDVESTVRKLPERRMESPSSAPSTPDTPAACGMAPDAHATPALPGRAAADTNVALRPPLLARSSDPAFAAATTPAQSTPSAPARKAPPPIEALSDARYRVQFTASASLKEKLDRARDLLRHRNPSGDLAPIVERALDLLLEQLMKERFGATHRPRPTATERGSDVVSDRRNSAGSDRVSNATRRMVVDRDGLQCSWVDSHGRRCEARAWLELDHRQPRAKGGGSGPDNVRLLCRPHNRLAAEHEYGRDHMEAAIAARRQAASAWDPTSSAAPRPGAEARH